MVRNLVIALTIIGFGYIAIACLAPNPLAPTTMSAQRAADALTELNVPFPPSGFITNVENGGLFAKYIFIRMEVSPEELSQYMDQFPEGLAISAPDGIRVVTIEDYNPNVDFSPGQEIKIKQSVNGGYLPWWEIDSIQNGNYFYQALPDACGFEVFSDTNNSILYIYWHHS